MYPATRLATASFPRVRRISARALLGLAALPVCMLASCTATTATPREAEFVFVYLTTGPKSAEPQGEERKKIFAGHMANIHRLADARQLIIAGPFSKPQNPAWRGIFIMDVPTIAAARPLVETDPGVQAGVFTPEYRGFRASPVLRKALDIDRELEAARKATSQPEAAPPNVRPYVMITAPDAGRAAQALARATLDGAPLARRTLWSGRFADEDGRVSGAGVFIIDSKSADEVREALRDGDCRDCVVDGWFSTAAHEKLPRE